MPLSKRTDFGDAKYAGVEVDDRASYDVPGALYAVLDAGFDFMVAPLALQPAQRRSRLRRLQGIASVPGAVSADFGSGDGAPPPPWAPSDLLLPSSAWSSQVVGKLSTWIDCDADADAEDADAGDDESASEHSGGRGDAGRDADAVTAATAAASPRAVRRELALDSEAALAQELAWAAHLSLQAVILQPPPPPPPAASASSRRIRRRPRLGPNGARAVCSGLRGLGAPAVWLRLPLWWREEGRATGAEGEGGRNEKEDGEACDDDADQEDPWHSWDELRHLCEHSSRLGVMLELPAKISPGGFSSSSSGGGGGGEGGAAKDHPAVAALRRWVGEPLKAVCLPSAAFVANKRGFPALPRVHQELLQVAFAAGVQVVMGGAPEIVPPPLSPPRANGENAGGGGGMGTNDPLSADASAARAAREYLAHVFRRPGPPALPGGNADHMSDEDARRLREDLAGYRDFLQAPLQPLQDDLESSTYETFERDSPKYSAYGEAVACYLSDRLAARKAAEAGVAERGEGDVTVIMVVGAGRGPLVRASLAAADSVGARVRVYAVEKNPNAVITLQGLLATEPAWRGRVCVVARDMRRWRAPEAADLLVSELLGSFGDNELSPECLDGAQRFLKKGTGVSIPASYTSFLEPVTAAKPWSDARGSGGGGGGGGGGSAGDGGGGGGNGGCGENSAAAVQALETPYVVHLHRFTSCSRGSTRPVFTFDHPRKGAGAWKGVGGKEDRGGKGGGLEEDESDGGDDDDDDPNARRITLRFDRRNQPSALVHGLAGYFETTLYSSRRTGKAVKLSTHPPTHTPGMASWFPILFPLVSPLRAPAGCGVEVSMWRRRKGARVWYEWSAKCGGSATHVHNPGGRSYYVGL